MIFTSHQLPFPFFYSEGVFEAGLPASLHVKFANENAINEVMEVVSAFVTLATFGAFAGASIYPSRSSINVHTATSTSTNDLWWSFEDAHLSDEALVVLAHLLLGVHGAVAIDRVEVVANGATASLRLQTDVSGAMFPGEFHQLPFKLDGDDMQGEDYAFEIELMEPLYPANEDWLNSMLLAWCRVVMLGGYADAPTRPADAYVETDEKIVTYDNVVEWALFKLRADGASIDALLNGLAAFDGRCQQINRVEML